jgi:hypothetical protein
MKKTIVLLLSSIFFGCAIGSCASISAKNQQINDLILSGYPIIFEEPVVNGSGYIDIKYKNISTERIDEITFVLYVLGSEHDLTDSNPIKPNKSRKSMWGAHGGWENGKITSIVVIFENGKRVVFNQNSQTMAMLFKKDYLSDTSKITPVTIAAEEQPKPEQSKPKEEVQPPNIISFDNYDLLLNDNYYSIVKYKGSEKNIEIPSEYDGIPVRTINTSAFTCNYKIDSISIPASITEIRARSFSIYPPPEKIILPGNIEDEYIKKINFSDYAFAGMEKVVLQCHNSEIIEDSYTLNNETLLCIRIYQIVIDGRNVNQLNSYIKSQISRVRAKHLFSQYTYLLYNGNYFEIYNIDKFNGNIDIYERFGKMFFYLNYLNHRYFGYNDNVYEPYTNQYWFTPASHQLIYIKEGENGIVLCKENEIISKTYYSIQFLNIDDADNIFYAGGRSQYSAGQKDICRNNTILISESNIGDVQVLQDGTIYYLAKIDGFDHLGQILAKYVRGESPDVTFELVYDNFYPNRFTVSNDGKNIAYTVIVDDKDEMSLYINEKLQYTAWVLGNLSYSPDGKKLYYVETRNARRFGNKNNMIRGPGIAPTIAGPYWNVFDFSYSKDSKYVAIPVEKTGDGYYILLNSDIYGPYSDIDRKGYFSEDSRHYTFRYKNTWKEEWSEKTINLR